MLTTLNKIVRKNTYFMLIVALIITGLFSFPREVHAVMVEKNVTKYHLDIGAQHIWGRGNSVDTAVWDNGLKKGGSISINTTLTFNTEVSNVKAYPLTSSNFRWGEQGYSFNRTKYLQNREDYRNNYERFASSSIYNVNSSSSGRNVFLSYTATLASREDFDLKTHLNTGQLSYILDMLGGASVVQANYPEVYARLVEGAQNGIAPNVYGFMYFTPVVIQYDVKEMVEVGEIDANLSLPSTAKQNEGYTVADASFVDGDLTVATATLEKHYGDGIWKPVATWPGKGTGQNSGGSIEEKESNICTITYRLTVATTDGQKDTDMKTINITDARVFDGEADLVLPRYSYEGHPVEADDFSTFTVDGEGYSARRMYEEGLAYSRFKPQASASASVRTLTLTSAEIIFPKKGEYDVTLEVRIKDGKVLTDVEQIDIYKTPKIAAALSGKQKENRKQSLNISVATYPGCPITELWVELESADGKESIRLYKDGGLNNSETIKTRAISTENTTQYFSKYRLDFLTKNTEIKEYRYRVYTKDSRGYTDQVEEAFVVVPDQPPKATINVEDSFIRNKGTDVATITTEDGSTTDGDQVERTWYVKDKGGAFQAVKGQPNYKDLSFGTSKKVSFNRTGVGKVALKLEVKDLWTEETLPEYITELDYKRGSTTKETDVINIAPVVSISPIHTKTAGILMLAAGQEEYRFLNANKNALMEKLIEKEIDGEIRIEKMAPKATTDGSIGYNQLFSVSLPLGFNADTTFLENNFHIVDNEALYTINATWAGSYHDVFPEMPYYITCWDPYTKTEKWSYTLTSDVMNIARSQTKAQKGFAQDDQGKYLFFRYGGETLVLSKDNGAYLTKLKVELGDENYLAGNAIYTIKADGIYSVSAETGNVKKLYNGAPSGKTKKLDNAIHFLDQSGPMTINRGQLNLSDESLKMTRILGTEKDPISTSYTCIGIDMDGVMMVGINKNMSVRVYSRENALIKTISGWSTGYSYSVAPAYDEKGKCEYLVSAFRSKGSKNYYDNAAAFGIYNDYYSYYDKNVGSGGWIADPDYPMYASKMGDKLYYQLGSPWAGLWGGGGIMSYYSEYASLYIYDLKTSAISRTSSSDLAFGAAGEYGSTSETFFAPSYTYNLDQQTLYENGLNTKVVKWQQNIDDILSRYLKKLSLENKALNTIFLYDNTNRDEINPMNLSLGYLKEKDFDFIFAKDPDDAGRDELEESYGKRIVSGLKEVGQRANTLVRNSAFINDITTLIAQEEDTPKTVLAIHNASGAGESSISREYQLDANKTYFYEYEIKTSTTSAVGQPFAIDFKQKRAVESPNLLDEHYRVVAMEEEDFNDGDTNSFFTLAPSRRAEDGTYNLATLNAGKTSLPNSTFSDASDIIFNVPEGKKAILTFTYNVRSGSGSWANATIMINGERYHRLQYQNPMVGTYTHYEFLPEGENRLGGYVIDYGTRPMSTYSIIDNLKVIYVENEELSNRETLNLHRKGGESQTFIAPQTGTYEVKLWGPASDSGGGLIEGKISLNKGDSLEASLGPGVPVSTGARNGANGVSGKGYGDEGAHQATLKRNGHLVMVAGGGASNGNPGTGDGSRYGSTITYGNKEICGGCGQRLTSTHWLYRYNGIGGAGGLAGIGGDVFATHGYVGANGSASSGYTSGSNHYTYYAGGKGGDGGSGGASYVDASALLAYKSIPGGSYQESRLKISYQRPFERETEHRDNPTSVANKLEDGWVRYSGTLKTPFKTMSYQGQTMDYVFQNFALDGNSVYAIRDATNSDNKTLAINIPAGKYAIDTGVNVDTRPATSGSNSWNVTWKWGGYTWLDRGDNSYGGIKDDIPSPNFRIVLPTIQGKQNLTENARAYNGSSGDFKTVELQIVEELNAPINEGRYFFDKKNERVYMDNVGYTEAAKVTLSGGEDEEWYLRDFKIYAMEKGVKVYVTGEDIKKVSELNKWTMSNARGSLFRETKETTEDEVASVVYKKGQLVAYDISYSDYENDPSKKQFWRYTHTPFSDGSHPDAAVILDANGSPSAITGKVLGSSIPRFYIDGKYKVEHWQEDNTTRGLDPAGNPDYDKASNIETLTFYVEGSSSAPWITSIRTIPGNVKEGEAYKIQVGVDDLEKDVLSLTTEVYKERRLLYSHKKTGITVDGGGNYPYTLTGDAPIAVGGTYEIVCTVRDDTGAGLGTYRFTVTTEGKVAGYVQHTNQWDLNRKRYNLKRFGSEINRVIDFDHYMKEQLPRPRGTNVFWSGEKFVLSADVAGNADSVTAEIKEFPGYKTRLNSTGKKNGKNETIYTGELWEGTMINRWGRKTPQPLTFIFTAQYPGGLIKRDEAIVIVDSKEDYWKLHRLW